MAQVRDLAMQRRENDLVIATFGRGFFVLDDYTPLREMSAQALTEDAHLFALRDAYLFNLLGQRRPAPPGSARWPATGRRRIRRLARCSRSTCARIRRTPRSW